LKEYDKFFILPVGDVSDETVSPPQCDRNLRLAYWKSAQIITSKQTSEYL